MFSFRFSCNKRGDLVRYLFTKIFTGDRTRSKLTFVAISPINVWFYAINILCLCIKYFIKTDIERSNVKQYKPTKNNLA